MKWIAVDKNGQAHWFNKRPYRRSNYPHSKIVCHWCPNVQTLEYNVDYDPLSNEKVLEITGSSMTWESEPFQINKLDKPLRRNTMKVITDLNEIDRTTEEGRLLFAALAKITTESQTDRTPDEVLAQLVKLATAMDDNKSLVLLPEKLIEPDDFTEGLR
jgi:hypothetical protein